MTLLLHRINLRLHTAPAPAPAPTPTANVRVIHASPDAPEVNVYAADAILAGLENVDYQVASPWITVDEGSYDIRVEQLFQAEMRCNCSYANL